MNKFKIFQKHISLNNSDFKVFTNILVTYFQSQGYQ